MIQAVFLKPQTDYLLLTAGLLLNNPVIPVEDFTQVVSVKEFCQIDQVAFIAYLTSFC
jgi:hypothetical protein